MLKYKAFIIGCGKIAGLYDDFDDNQIYSHARAYFENHKIDLVGCYDSNFDRSSQLAEKFETSSYDENYLEAFNIIKPDIVSICTPDVSHFEIVESILMSSYVPKIIFLEKPACDNHAQFKLSLINI